MANTFVKIMKGRFAKGLFILLTTILSFYLAFCNHLEPSQIGIARNWISGEMWLQKAGWHISPPWVWVARIDTRPIRVSIPSAGHGYNTKLVQFDPNGWQEFINVEGWRYYWWANRLSFNFGYDEEHRGMKDILRGHAYGVKRYSFIKIIEEYESH